MFSLATDDASYNKRTFGNVNSGSRKDLYIFACGPEREG